MSKRILVVDDNDAVGAALRLQLLNKGYDVNVVASGSAALDQLGVDVPDLVILDVTMTLMAGYDVCRWMRAHAPTRSVPIIFISMQDGLRERVEAADAGSDLYLVKSAASSKLLNAVDLFLGDAP